MRSTSRLPYALAASVPLALAAFCLQSARAADIRGVKAEKYSSADWWPTQGAAVGADYVGPSVCAGCHATQASTQLKTLMARAAAAPADSDVLRAHPSMLFRSGPYHYQIRREADRTVYSVRDGTGAISEPVAMAFGFGALGQTYVFRHAGKYYESHVSYFTELEDLDITIGHSPAVPASLEKAIGTALNPRDVNLCFSCHSTAAVVNHRVEPSGLIPGVTCEACHGPGAQHVAAMKSGKLASPLIFNPARLQPDELVEFCGACHRTALAVIAAGTHGPQTVRFQPYRLVSSRCWDPTDARISCVACHDPHKDLVRDASAYDAKCLACHRTDNSVKTSEHPGPRCPVSPRACATCHMPRIELPGGHAKFSDHFIRVVRPGEAYPE